MNVKELAKQAGFDFDDYYDSVTQEELERFSELVRADEREKLKSEANVWNDDSVSMPLNKFCRAWVNWSSYSTDGDSFQHGRAEAIVLKYKRNPDEEAFVFIHRGHKQYLRESFDIIKWQLLDPKPSRKKALK